MKKCEKTKLCKAKLLKYVDLNMLDKNVYLLLTKQKTKRKHMACESYITDIGRCGHIILPIIF